VLGCESAHDRVLQFFEEHDIKLIRVAGATEMVGATDWAHGC